MHTWTQVYRFSISPKSSCWTLLFLSPWVLPCPCLFITAGSWEHLSLSVLRPLGAICKTHTALNQALPGHSGSFLWVCLIFQSFEFSVKTHFAGQTFVIGELCWGREREQRFQEAMATHLACFEFYWGHAVWAKATEKIHTWPLILTVEKLTATQHLIFKTLGCCLVKSEARSPVLFP